VKRGSSGNVSPSQVCISDFKQTVGGASFQRIETFIRPNMKAIIHLPKPLTVKEANRLKRYIDLSVLSNIRGEEKDD
jgi:hypothetical protein